MHRTPSNQFSRSFMELFPSENLSLRARLEQTLNELDAVPDSFCGAAWFPKTFDFSYLSPRIEDILGHHYSNYFKLGALFLHSTIPPDLVPEMNHQVGQLMKTLQDDSFDIAADHVFRVHGTSVKPDGTHVSCLESLIILDRNPSEGNFFMIACWRKTNDLSQAEREVNAAHVEKLLIRAKAIYRDMYPENFKKMLSFQEKKIVQLLSQGLTTKEIGSRLSISFHTVESHRKNLLEKFGAHNSSELISKVAQAGLLKQ
jgi:DNA-binding CsgD family transcriptional regulator